MYIPEISPFALKVLETEDSRDLTKAYGLLVGQLADFENEKIEVCVVLSSRGILTCRRWPLAIPYV